MLFLGEAPFIGGPGGVCPGYFLAHFKFDVHPGLRVNLGVPAAVLVRPLNFPATVTGFHDGHGGLLQLLAGIISAQRGFRFLRGARPAGVGGGPAGRRLRELFKIGVCFARALHLGVHFVPFLLAFLPGLGAFLVARFYLHLHGLSHRVHPLEFVVIGRPPQARVVCFGLLLALGPSRGRCRQRIAQACVQCRPDRGSFGFLDRLLELALDFKLGFVADTANAFVSTLTLIHAHVLGLGF